jgi:DNA topoisomerase I
MTREMMTDEATAAQAGPHRGTAETLAAAGLELVSPFGAGIRRVRTPRGLEYCDVDGRPVQDPATLERIKKLAIPPAWRDVWISPSPVGHIQATGMDAAGRKQYRYHAAWRDLRDHDKFDEILTFGELLPRIRKNVQDDLGGTGLGHQRVLAGAVRLLDLGAFRIGTDRYAVADDTHGLTTMLTRDVTLHDTAIVFEYVGKEHKRQIQCVVDTEVGRMIRQLLAIRQPDERLFAFNLGNRTVALHAGDVNHYLKQASGMQASAKEFRTWNATVLAAAVLAQVQPPNSTRARQQAVNAAVSAVASYLGNTPAVARRAYVDPRVVQHYVAGWTVQPELAALADGFDLRPPAMRRPLEEAVIDLLHERPDSPGLLRRPVLAGLVEEM